MTLNYDPLQPVYAEATEYKAPTLTDPNAILGQTKDVESYIDPAKATVEGRATGLLASGNPMLEQAQQQTLRTGNSRGLLNTRGTAQAGTEAMIGKAVEIASPDAATYADFGKANQAVENQGLINNQTAALESQQKQNDAEITGSLAEQNYGNTQKVNQSTQYLQAEIAKDYKQFTFDFDKQLVDLGISAAERKSAQDAISAQTQTMMGIMGSLLNNTDIVMDANTHTWVSDWMTKSWQTTASLYNLEIEVV
jgi:hypothetical protein